MSARNTAAPSFIRMKRNTGPPSGARKRWCSQGNCRTCIPKLSPAGTFYRAEEYHQDYYKKNPFRYRFYRFTCGRDARLAEVWNGNG